PNADASKSLSFDIVGYKPKKIKSLPKSREILLQKITVLPNKDVNWLRTETEKSGEIPDDPGDPTKTSNFFKEPAIMAKYFPYKNKYSKAPYLAKVKVSVISQISGAVYKLRIFNVGHDGQPGSDVLTEDFIITAPK